MLSALSGEPLCTISVGPMWPVHRLRTEIARLQGTPEPEQRLFLAGGPSSAAQALDRDSQRSVAEALAGSDVLLLMRVQVTAESSSLVDVEPGVVQVSAYSGAEEGPAQVAIWVIDANLFFSKGSTCEASPKFKLEVNGVGPVEFKMLLVPRGATTFRRAQGRGGVQLKCMSALQASAPLTFGVSLLGGGAGAASASAGRTESFAHDFGRNALWAGDHEPMHLQSVATTMRRTSGPPKPVLVVQVEVFGSTCSDAVP